MDKSTIRKEIAVLINSIKEHSDNIGDKEQIPQLELELILHKIEKLYQKSIVFNHLNSMPRVRENASYVEKKEDPVAEKTSVAPQVIEAVKEISKEETVKSPTDLFGSELPPVPEKPKVEKKVEKKEEKPVVSRIQKPAITDLTKAIGLNDKFLFANELFEGNMQEYNIAVQQLNTAETIESAMEYISSLQQLYEWDAENETVKRLLDLVDRRYS
ncbi:MAG TPA: hypothetical protein VGC65_09440 [Bacteroidia bacterium]|jgi:hypothetical protein